MSATSLPSPMVLCASHELAERGAAIVFDVYYRGQTLTAFAVRYEGQVFAYLNRCSHLALELDWQRGQFFDSSSCTLICANHGAQFDPTTGACLAGPGRGPLIKIDILEQNNLIYWQPTYELLPVSFD